MASTARVDAFHAIADEFMFEILDLFPGDYLITDESRLRDFTDMNSDDTSAIWERIQSRYTVLRSEVPSDLLIEIFLAIDSRRHPQ